MRIFRILSIVSAIFAMVACTNNEKLADFSFPSQTGTLKSAASQAGFPIGTAIGYSLYMNNDTFATTVNREFSSVTFGYEMKHGAIVQSNGSLNFTNADAMFSKATAAGLAVYGHCLVWYQNNNGDYLRSLVSGSNQAAMPNLVSNGGFESGTAGWSQYNPSGAAIYSISTSNPHTGSNCLQIINSSNTPSSQWNTQIHTGFTVANLTSGVNYQVSFWIRSDINAGAGRCSTTGGSAHYQGNFVTSQMWTQITWTFTGNGTETGLNFDLGMIAGTYYIDDVVVQQVATTSTSGPSQANVAAVDSAMHTWISGMVGHYKGKIAAWDVVNEAINDGSTPTVRMGSASTTADQFYWAYYLGRDYAVKAFQYAKAADPAALLFINDYNLETNPAKLDSLLSYVKEIQALGAKVDGIGTQMHISYNNWANIDVMFQKLAATGLKIRVSELDVRVNPANTSPYVPDIQMLNNQAVTYQYIVQSYLKYVPAAQRYGITIWGVHDPDSWIVVNQKQNDFPLLFDNNYNKKPAYYGVMQGLEGKSLVFPQ